jgi:hypothetical protein
MEQFIGCDAHKKFSVFGAVNEKGHAGEALRVAHDRHLYREFLARLAPKQKNCASKDKVFARSPPPWASPI